MKFEGRGGGDLPRLIALLGHEVGLQHTSPLFVFVSLETSDSLAEWTADVFKCVCVEEWSYKTCEKVFWLMG